MVQGGAVWCGWCGVVELGWCAVVWWWCGDGTGVEWHCNVKLSKHPTFRFITIHTSCKSESSKKRLGRFRELPNGCSETMNLSFMSGDLRKIKYLGYRIQVEFHMVYCERQNG